jgi:hypothetical protein
MHTIQIHPQNLAMGYFEDQTLSAPDKRGHAFLGGMSPSIDQAAGF